MGSYLDSIVLDLVNGTSIEDFLDKAHYEEILRTELREYDVSALLESAMIKREESRIKNEKMRLRAGKAAETKRKNRERIKKNKLHNKYINTDHLDVGPFKTGLRKASGYVGVMCKRIIK